MPTCPELEPPQATGLCPLGSSFSLEGLNQPSSGKESPGSASAGAAEPHVQVCSQQIAVHRYAQTHKHVGTLPQHYVQSHRPQTGRTAPVYPLHDTHLANLLEHRQTATWHTSLTGMQMQDRPRQRHVTDTITCM